MLNTLIADKKEMNTHIIAAAQELINITGIKNITIDDVANELRIPQQTIYKLFPGKAQLIEAIVEKQIEDKKTVLQKVRIHANNSIKQVFLGWNVLSNFFQSLNNESINQLKKYNTQSFKLVTDFKTVFLYNYFKANIDTGITQEVYRHNIKTQLLSRYLIEIFQVPVMSRILQRNRLGSVEAEDQLLSYHLYGMATEKGIRLIRRYKNEFLAFSSPYK